MLNGLARDYVDDLRLGRPDDWRPTAVYGFAHFGKSLFWYTGELLFAFVLTEIMGLSGTAMGMTLAAGLIVSAVLDLLAGARMQGVDARTAIRLQLIGSVLSAVALGAFLAGKWVPEAQRAAYALATGLAFRIAYAFYDVPQNALLGLATGCSSERTRVVAIRLACSGFASLAVSVAAGPLLSMRSAWRLDMFDLSLISSIMSVIAVASAALLASLPFQRRPSLQTLADAGSGRRLVGDCHAALLMALLTSGFLPLFGKLSPYLTEYSVASTPWTVVITAAFPLGSIVSQCAWPSMVRAFTRPRVSAACCLGLILSAAAFSRLGASSPPRMSALTLLIGMGSGGLGFIVWSRFADLIEELHLDAVWAFSLFTAVQKVGLAVGSLILGFYIAQRGLHLRGGSDIAATMAYCMMAGAVSCLVLVNLGGVAMSLASRLRA